jgi:hypothetical protein
MIAHLTKAGVVLVILWAWSVWAADPITVALSLPEGLSIPCGPRTTKLVATTTGPVVRVEFFYGESPDAMRVVAAPPFQMDWSVDCRWSPPGSTKLSAVAVTADGQQVKGQLLLTVLAPAVSPVPVPTPTPVPTPVPTPTPVSSSCTEGAYTCTCSQTTPSVTGGEYTYACACKYPIIPAAQPVPIVVPAEVDTLLAKTKWLAADGYKALKIILKSMYGK